MTEPDLACERQTLSFGTGGHESRAIVYPVSSVEGAAGGGARFARAVLAPGASATQEHPSMTGLARALAANGVEVVTFNFVYTERGRKRPDPAPVLERTWLDAVRLAVEAPRDDGAPLFIGGRSMGGRIATHIAAGSGLPGSVAGVVCFGYPLNPPTYGRPRTLEHFATIRVPLLVVQGTRDAFGGPDDVRAAAAPFKAIEVHAVEHADHSFAVPRKTGRPAREVMDGVAAFVAAWMRRHVESSE